MTDQAFNAGVAAIVGELRQLRESLDAVLCAVMDSGDDEPGSQCLHPEDARVNFGMTKGLPDFHCRACGFRSVAES